MLWFSEIGLERHIEMDSCHATEPFVLGTVPGQPACSFWREVFSKRSSTIQDLFPSWWLVGKMRMFSLRNLFLCSPLSLDPKPKALTLSPKP